MRAVAVVGLLVITGACGASDVTESSEYLTLIEERDSLAIDLETLQSDATELEIELDDVRRELLEVNDDSLRLTTRSPKASTIKSDFIDDLALRLHRERIERGASPSVSATHRQRLRGTAGVPDVAVIPDPSSAEVVAVDLTLTTAVSECDLDDPTDQPSAPATPGPPDAGFSA